MPQFGPMPISKTYFKFVANDKAINHLENMEASVFPDGFKVLSSEYASSGKRILIVTDRVSKDDLDEGMLLSGNEAGVYDNLLAWALNDKDPDIQIKQVVAFNWPFAWLKNDKNKEQIDEARGLYLARLKRFIDRWKPHAVVLAGADMYSYIFDSLVGRYPHKMYANRLISVNWGNHTCPTLGTIDLYRPISWDNKFSKTYPHLLGYLGRGIATAMNGRNRFSAVLPKKNEITFSYISNINQFKAFYKGLLAAKRVSIDTETTSLARAHNTLLSIQFAWALDRAFFIPIDHPETPFSAKEIRYIKRKLADYFENGTSQFHVYQNGKFDVCQLFGLGVRFNNHRIYDVQGGEFALDENRKILQVVLGVKPYSLDFIAEQRGCSIYRQISFSKGDRGSIKDQHLPNKVDQKRKSSKNSLVIYGCYDVLVPLAIVNAQIKEAKHRQFKKFLLFVCEQLGDATHAFSQMEYSGYHVDKAYLFKLKSKEGPLSTKIAEAASKLRASKAVQQVNRYLMDKQGVPQGGGLFGNSTWVFDINKPAHLQLLFFNALKLEPLDVRKDGGGKTGKEFQEKYKTVPEIADYNQYQKLKTLRDTFVNGIYSRMSRDIDALRDNNIRSNYSYTTVVTSRTSSADPNLQNIPTRGMLAKIIKRMFIAIVGCLFVKNDYSAHEIRDWANESDDRNLSASFYAGLKYRQDLRLVAYSYPEQAIAWSEHKAKHGWFDVKDYNKKLEILDKVKDKITKGIGKAELELEIKGDVHKLNCITGDSLIPTDKGLLRIGEIVHNNFRVIGSPNKISVKVGSIEQPTKAVAWLYQGKKSTLDIVTGHGNSLRCTASHGLLVFDSSLGDVVWREAGMCKTGDYLCINPVQQTRKTALPLNLTTVGMLPAYKHSPRVFSMPKTMTTELAFIISCLVAEGHIQIDGRTLSIGFSNSDKNLLNRYCALLQSVFGVIANVSLVGKKGTNITIGGVPTKITKNLYSAVACSKQLVHWMQELGLYTQSGRRDGKVASHYKQVPWSILQADEQSQLSFIAAYLECDGNVENISGALRWFSASKRLASELQAILNAHGFVPTLSQWKSVWALTLDGKQSVDLWSRIQPFMCSKTLTVKERRSHTGVPTKYWAGVVEQRRVSRNTFINDKKEKVQIKGWRNYFNKVDSISYSSAWVGYNDLLANVQKISTVAHTKLEKMLKTGYHFTPIVSIKKGKKEDVYDLSMQRGAKPAFIANGLVVHNCEIFYQTPVLEVTDDQRQDIKALVFGTVYGKTPEGLARTLNKSDEYAQGLQDTLFEKFPRGAKWLRQVERNGQKNLYVESPLGAQRHLWGYLHTRKGVVNAMNRRGPNSIIQGVASSIGISSIRIMQKLIWFMFTKQGVPFHWRSTINYVHDSVESETKYHLIPIYLYLIEHASTTLIHRRYRKIFDYKLNIGLELEFQLGASVDRVSKWNFMADSLFAKIEQEMKWQKEELGYKPDFKHIDLARHNWKIIADVRKEELAESVKSKKPAEIMLLTPKNVNNVGFKIGLPENA